MTRYREMASGTDGEWNRLRPAHILVLCDVQARVTLRAGEDIRESSIHIPFESSVAIAVVVVPLVANLVANLFPASYFLSSPAGISWPGILVDMPDHRSTTIVASGIGQWPGKRISRNIPPNQEILYSLLHKVRANFVGPGGLLRRAPVSQPIF